MIALLLASSLVMGPWHQVEVTAYSHSCVRPRSGKEGPPARTASGVWPVANWSVAAPRSYPFGTTLEFSYQGIIARRVVHDRGRDIKGARIDLFMETCGQARRWGRRMVWMREVERPLGGTR